MEVKQLIRSIISKEPQHGGTNEFIGVCLRMAIVYLRKKASGGRLNPSFFGLSIEDLATDLIADLFQRDEKGVFVQITKYFRKLDCENLLEEELMGYTRQLVFSKVTEQLCRLYRQHDPALAKVLRNLKDVLKCLDQCWIEKIGGIAWISLLDQTDEECALPISCPRNFSKPNLLKRWENVWILDMRSPASWKYSRHKICIEKVIH